jgi:hypothetical protein
LNYTSILLSELSFADQAFLRSGEYGPNADIEYFSNFFISQQSNLALPPRECRYFRETRSGMFMPVGAETDLEHRKHKRAFQKFFQRKIGF